jgi:ATP-dependent helicase HrpB
MSATHDPGPVAAFLGNCPVIDVPGTLHPLTIEYAPGETIAAALEVCCRAAAATFCASCRERERIAAAMNESERVATAHGIELVALHGSMDGAAQDTALSPSSRSADMIMATNIAETSLTVSGVTAVIDTAS